MNQNFNEVFRRTSVCLQKSASDSLSESWTCVIRYTYMACHVHSLHIINILAKASVAYLILKLGTDC